MKSSNTKNGPKHVLHTEAEAVLGASAETFVHECSQLVAKGSKLYAGHVSAKPLSKLDKKHALKFRNGGESTIETVLSLWSKYGGPLPNVVVGDIPSKMAHVAVVKVLRHELEVFLKLLDDDIFRNQSGCWRLSTQLYGVLKKLGETNPDLQLGLAPVAEFFQPKKVAASGKKQGGARSKKSAEPPAPEPPPATSNGVAHAGANGAAAPALTVAATGTA